MFTPVATLLYGRIRTLDRGRPSAEAVAWEHGRILAVGGRAEVEAAAGPSPDVIDAGARTIAPGFIDAHHHVAVSALYDGALRLEAPRVHDVASLLSALREEAARVPAGRFVVGTQWDEGRLRERRAPTRDELDAALPEHPAFLLHYTCHRALANTRALALAGIDRARPDPEGGRIVRDRSGAPSGLLIEQGMSRVEALARAERVKRDGEGVLARMAAHYRAVARAGITRLCDAAVPHELLALFRELAARGGVSVPTHVCPVSSGGWLEPPLDALEGPPTGAREGPLVIGPIKLVFDGAPGCAMCLSWRQSLTVTARSALLSLRHRTVDPLRTALSVTPRLGRQIRTGIAIYRRDSARAIVARVSERGLGLATHAIGNEAIDTALDAYAAAGASLHRGGVPRLEHAAFASVAQARRMADLGIAAVVQPAMIAMPSMAGAAPIPGLPFMPLARLAAAGVALAGSSDYPVTTFDPLVGLRAAMGRTTAWGDTVDPEQRVDLDTALAMFTRGAAEVLGCADETGSLAPGKRADLVILDGLDDADPTLVDTFVGGARVSCD